VIAMAYAFPRVSFEFIIAALFHDSAASDISIKSYKPSRSIEVCNA
jgi:hypothetical protein